MQKLLFIVLTALTFNVKAQSQKEQYFKSTRAGFNEKNAYATTAFVEQFFRLPGNKGFDASIYRVEEILKKAGYVLQKKDEFEAPLTYRIEKRPMKRDAWEPVDANISIVGESEPLQSFKTNRNMIPINCFSTPAEGVTAEVIFVNKATKEDLAGKDLKGKIVFGDMPTQRLVSLASKAGAVGALGFALPEYNQPTKHTTSI
ncbi:MAG: peptidase M28, partial [Chitinophagaceae bacterium]